MISSEQLTNFIQIEAPKMNGWFFDGDIISFCIINNIQNMINISGSICEVGVWEGKSLVLLSKFLSDSESLYGYDLFTGDLKNKTMENLTLFGNPKNVKLIASDTSCLNFNSVSEDLMSGVRILHIDAGHEYHEVVHQLALFAPFVKLGGCIIMDDYQDREFPGIEAAVLDFCDKDRPRRFVPFFAGGNKIYLCEKQYASIYQKLMLREEIIGNQARVTVVRDFLILVGFSKLPVAADICLKSIEQFEFPLRYDDDEVALSRKAAKFGQFTFGSGVIGN